MKLQKVEAIALGIVESAGGTRKDGTTFDPYFAVNIAPQGDISQRIYLNISDRELIADARRLCGWGKRVVFDGEIDLKGHMSISAIYADEDSEDFEIG